jgi:hypothetical protein
MVGAAVNMDGVGGCGLVEAISWLFQRQSRDVGEVMQRHSTQAKLAV